MQENYYKIIRVYERAYIFIDFSFVINHLREINCSKILYLYFSEIHCNIIYTKIAINKLR